MVASQDCMVPRPAALFSVRSPRLLCFPALMPLDFLEKLSRSHATLLEKKENKIENAVTSG